MDHSETTCKRCGRPVLVAGMVAITTGEYRALVERKAEADVAHLLSDLMQLPSRSKILRNLPMAAFILSLPHTLTLDEILERCRVSFDSDAPSRSTLHRFLQSARATLEGR